MFGVLDELEEAVDKGIATEARLDPVQLARILTKLEFLFARSVNEVDRNVEWADNYASPTAWLTHTCKLSVGAARAVLKNGKAVAAMPAVADAFATGAITKEHVHAISHALTPAREATFVDADEPLAAAAQMATVRELRGIVQYLTGAFDGDGGAAADDAARRKRYLYLSPLLDGYAINGFVDRECGKRLDAVFKAYIKSSYRTDDTRDDTRTTAQRRADALVELVECGLAQAKVGGYVLVPEFLTVLDISAHEERDPVAVAQARAEYARDGQLSQATIERLCCDAAFTRVIKDGKSQVLDVGRKTRNISPALRRALIARDRGCTEDGCDMPPDGCEVHHKIPWQDGGPTNLENCELKCRRDHIRTHERLRKERGP